ncbi:MAG TPA: RDD family protein [Muricauda sp.]|uniref:RDD family protein n=1 Tax=Flagellimonas aurea TaxID=2915619 RepID=A0ABS3GAP3_9FLAO|nr:RDD family protein [Allomuricauda aurea]MAO17766.1 transporter [Allomuricauda sp.]UBZ13062.1 RDD family protein [Allomuricauda aquimarina]MBC71802.1 transporter [Allomuricauda sp.]MBO0355958.1 RDD family protein [Allomuricauda aurea]HBU79333.1 RDD family protein [Allomuricauda sp.]|tara:strand:+ start:183 stop:899 length:717 start_codon:yes stop_codon:yes gene_type:complete
MEQFQIETAQNITINQNTSHLGERMLAYIIDTFIIVVYTILMFVFLASLDIDMGDQWAFYLILSLPAFLYYLLFETLMDGKTIGKGAMNLRVVKLDGSKPNFGNYFVRWALRIIDVGITSGGAAVLTILVRGKGQRIGDIAAGTTVISEKKRVSLKDTLLRELPDDYKPTFPQVTVFKDQEMRTIKELYDKARLNGNHNVIVSLDKRIKEVLGVQTTLKPMEFVDVIINDYNYYTQKM